MTIAIEPRLSQDPTGAAFVGMAAELVGLGVRAIVTFRAQPGLVAAAHTSRSVPIIAAGPNRRLIDIGLVSSLARPGANVTGVEGDARLDAKGVELLHDATPDVSRLGYLRNDATPGTVEQLARAQQAAAVLGLELLDLPARGPDDIDAAFERAASMPVGGLVVSTDFLFGDPSGWRVVPLALRYQLPAIYTQPAGYMAQGGLIALMRPTTSRFIGARRHSSTSCCAAPIPAELPVEQAMTFDFAINLKTARALGLTIPEHVLLQASELME